MADKSAPADTPVVSARGRVRRLTVNADDFAWSKSVNLGIVETHRDGIVTGSSIIAAGSAFDHAVELTRATPTLAMGMHLNIFRGFTVLSPERVPTLVGQDGRLLGSWKPVIARLATGRMNLGEVESELRAQIDKVLAAGITPTHFDSEKHLHLWPSVFKIVSRLAVEYEVPRVRVVREPFSLKVIPRGLTLLSAGNARFAESLGLSVPDATIGVTEPPVDDEALKRLLAHPQGEDVELIVHPGHVDDEFWELQGQINNRLTCSREEELRVLADPRSRQLVAEAGFTLAAQ